MQSTPFPSACTGLDYAKELSHCAVEAGVTVKIHVKIDTGMSRLGFYYQDISRDEATVQEVKAACTLPGLYPEGIFTHFAVSDEGESRGRLYHAAVRLL